MFWDVFEELCDKKGKTPSRVTEELHISRGLITKWKNGSTPKPETVNRLAEYFGVTPESLTFESKKGLVFWGNFKALCKDRNIYPSQVCEQLGISTGAPTKWKKGSAPREATVKSIADFFGVDPQSLFVSPSQTEEMSAEKQELIRLIDSMTDEEALKLAALADMLLHK